MRDCACRRDLASARSPAKSPGSAAAVLPHPVMSDISSLDHESFQKFLANAYAVLMLVAIAVSVAYWKLIGVLK